MNNKNEQVNQAAGQGKITIENETQVDRKGIFGWMLFDWSAQPFHTLIITFIFAPYFASAVVTTDGVPDPVKGQEWWGYAAGIGGLFIAFLSPILGALSDATGPRKPWIFGFSILAIAGVWSLWFVTPGADNSLVMFGLAAFVVALIGFEFAAVFNNAMMPSLVSREKMGALSGNAWALGYCGGLMVLVFVLLFLASNPETGKTFVGFDPIFGLDPDEREGDRAVGPITAMWYLLFVIPLFLFTPDSAKRARVAGAVHRGLSELLSTLKSLPQEKSLFSFLGASMLYRDALNGLFIFGGIYAGGVLGWTSIHLATFGILASIAGIFGCVLGGWADNRIGTKKVVVISIYLLMIACTILISTGPDEVFFTSLAAGSSLPDLVFYAGGCLVGAAGGALQAASRPLLVDQAKPGKMGEAFGLYALSGRATAFIAPFSIAYVTGLFDNQRVGITPVLLLFALGLLLLIPVRSRD
ncbi:MAG: MFS transporter [Rhizobiaceae bacterium]